jgi:hypothetical protein
LCLKLHAPFFNFFFFQLRSSNNKKTKQVLSMSPEEAERIRFEELFPVFEYDVQLIVDEVMSDPMIGADRCVGRLATAQIDLTLSSEHAQEALVQALTNTLTKVERRSSTMVVVENDSLSVLFL